MVHGNHVHVFSSPVSLTFSVESPKPLTIVPSDCCCRLAGSRYATHVVCLPQPSPWVRVTFVNVDLSPHLLLQPFTHRIWTARLSGLAPAAGATLVYTVFL